MKVLALSLAILSALFACSEQEVANEQYRYVSLKDRNTIVWSEALINAEQLAASRPLFDSTSDAYYIDVKALAGAFLSLMPVGLVSEKDLSPIAARSINGGFIASGLTIRLVPEEVCMNLRDYGYWRRSEGIQRTASEKASFSSHEKVTPRTLRGVTCKDRKLTNNLYRVSMDIRIETRLPDASH